MKENYQTFEISGHGKYCINCNAPISRADYYPCFNCGITNEEVSGTDWTKKIKLGGIKFPKKSRPLSPPKNSPDKDIWMTPPDLALKIVQYFGPSGDMIEPCMGEGSFYYPMKEYSDDGEVDWCELSKGRDFLEKDFCGQKYDWLISNFPFSKYADFLEKSMQVADNIVTYGTVCHVLSLKKRLRLIKEAGFFICEILYTDTPKEWNTGGFQCGAILLTKHKGDCKISYL